MNHANTVTCAARSRHSVLTPAGLHVPAAWQIREEGEYVPRMFEDDGYAANPAPTDAACAHTRQLRESQKLIEDAESLVGVLLDAIEKDGDTRAAQTRTVLEFTVECLHKAHQLIDEQESRDRNLFLSYFDLQGEIEDEKRGCGAAVR